ncbi:MAG: hypothetical protein KatS3mg119_1423 [Rhodothalassiaceae bacterium]|nr:MAG: hypothetical protein KatS3mg119_1423 [Rhodothalassiaceae bacterium]
MDLPGDGTVSVTSTDAFTDAVFVNYESFLEPDTLYVIEGAGAPQAIKALPPQFDAGPYVVEQFFAESEDGTQVPYFLIHRRDMPLRRHDADDPLRLRRLRDRAHPAVSLAARDRVAARGGRLCGRQHPRRRRVRPALAPGGAEGEPAEGLCGLRGGGL